MSLTIKAYLEKDGKPDGEIRRFSVPADVSSSYAYLAKRVAGIFPSLREGHFSMFWKDSDGDQVSFSADEELLEALGFVTDSVLKIYIRTKPNDNEGSYPAPEQPLPADDTGIHVGVICDACNGPIRGTRYKCMECEDYDLCATCEQKGAHSQHNMMKLTKPNRMPFYSPPQRGPGRCGFGRFPGAPFPGGPAGHGGEFAPPPHFRRWMRRFMRRWHSENTPGCPVENDSPDDDLSPPESGPDRVIGCVYKQQKRRQHRNKGIKKCCTRKPATIDLTQEVTEKMDTLIVSEDHHAEANGDVTDSVVTMVTGEKVVPNEHECINLTDVCVTEDSTVKEAQCQPMTATKMDVQRGGKEIDDNAWTLLTLSPTPDNSNLEPSVDPAICTQMVTPPTLSTQIVAPPTVAPPCVAPPTVQPPMMVPPMTILSPQQSVQVPQAQGPPSIMSNGSNRGHSVQFQMPPEVVYPPSNPRVAEALAQMISMGFNNDQGWLTRLLEAKNGDIIQVLDAIKPQPGRSRQTNGGYMA